MNGEKIGKIIAAAIAAPFVVALVGGLSIGAYAFLRWLWGVAL